MLTGETPISLEKIDIQIRELLQYSEQYIYPLELNKKQKIFNVLYPRSVWF